MYVYTGFNLLLQNLNFHHTCRLRGVDVMRCNYICNLKKDANFLTPPPRVGVSVYRCIASVLRRSPPPWRGRCIGASVYCHNFTPPYRCIGVLPQFYVGVSVCRCIAVVLRRSPPPPPPPWLPQFYADGPHPGSGRTPLIGVSVYRCVGALTFSCPLSAGALLYLHASYQPQLRNNETLQPGLAMLLRQHR